VFEAPSLANKGRAVVVVHVDDREVRPLLGDDLLGLGQARGRADDEQAVVQRQLDEIDHELAIVEDERAASPAVARGYLNGCHNFDLPVPNGHSLPCAR